MWTVLSHFDNLQVLQSQPPRSPLHALQKLFFFGDMFPYNSNSETHEKNEIENEKKHHATAVPLPRRIWSFFYYVSQIFDGFGHPLKLVQNKNSFGITCISREISQGHTMAPRAISTGK